MERKEISPRTNYCEKIEELGFFYHPDYWKECAYYTFTMQEIESLEKATKEIYAMYCEAVQHIIDNGLFHLFGIPDSVTSRIIESWNNDELSLYGRFDFAFVNGVPKLLEFNADTPTSLIEASIIQWQWKEELFKGYDQFNSIHESLVQSWKDIQESYNCDRYYFICCDENQEDEETVKYILSTAMEAGLNTAYMDISQFELYGDNKFHSPSGEDIACCFKLYPWEWMMNESIEGCMAYIRWIEPMWKSLMSNKMILHILWQLFPESQYILRCETSPEGMTSYCKKPIYSREGANITLVRNGIQIEKTGGEYGNQQSVFQELVDIQPMNERYPVIGSWVIGGEPAGIGIRETTSRITDNMSEFVPHVII